MNERVRAIRCPSCGAPIGLPEGGERLFACQFCGSTLEDQTTPEERETGSFPRLVIHELPQVTSPPLPRPEITFSPEMTKRTRRVGGLIALLAFVPGVIGVLVALVFVGIAVFGEPAFLSGLFSGRIYSYGLVRLVPGENDSQPDIIAVARYPDEISRMVYLDFDPEPSPRWTSEPLGDGAAYIYNASAYNQTHFFMVYETSLAAFDRATGEITWLVELSDEVSNVCQDCLQFFGDYVVALTADGRLSAFKVQTGETVWKVRLTTEPRKLINLAGRAAVIDEQEDEIGINIYQPDSGELLQRIVPTCPDDIFPDKPQYISIYGPVFITSDHNTMVVPLWQYTPGCLQTWDGTSLTKVQETLISNDILGGLSSHNYLFTDEILYIGHDENLYTVNLADGSSALAYSNPDYDFVPIDAAAGVSLVSANRTRGSNQLSLRGVHPDSGVEPWIYEPVAKEYIEAGSTVVDDDGVWYAYAYADKAIILEAFSDPALATLTVLNLLDGSIMNSNSVQFDKDDTDYWIQIPGWYQDQIFVVTGNQIRRIEASTGTQLGVWP